MAEVTQILSQIEQGDPTAAEQLLPLVYEELRKLAAAKLAQENPGQTLQATALVHEAYLRLVGNEKFDWSSKRHFYGAAAEAMRRILVEHARARGRKKRGGGRQRVVVSLADVVSDAAPEEFLAVHDALCRLEEVDERVGAIVRLRLFAGLSLAETGEALGIPLRTVERDWAYARAWLYERLA